MVAGARAVVGSLVCLDCWSQGSGRVLGLLEPE